MKNISVQYLHNRMHTPITKQQQWIKYGAVATHPDSQGCGHRWPEPHCLPWLTKPSWTPPHPFKSTPHFFLPVHHSKSLSLWLDHPWSHLLPRNCSPAPLSSAPYPPQGTIPKPTFSPAPSPPWAHLLPGDTYSPQKAAKVLKSSIEATLQCMLTAVIKKVEDKRLKIQMSWYTECAPVIYPWSNSNSYARVSNADQISSTQTDDGLRILCIRTCCRLYSQNGIHQTMTGYPPKHEYLGWLYMSTDGRIQ